MPVKLNWEDAEKRTLIAVYEGAWTWDDYYNTTTRIIELMKSVSQSVDLIVDYRQSAGYPTGNVISHVRAGAKLLRQVSNYGNFAMITTNSFVRIISTMYRKLRLQEGRRDQTFMVGDLEEAKKVLREARQPDNVG
jgi:hypothetical protein